MNLYYEDVQPGACFHVPGRVVTEQDLDRFADISGDDHPIHTDEQYARATPFGRRIAHGPFGIALAVGLFGRIPEFRETTLAMMDVREWTFRAPIYIGDLLSLQLTIIAKRITRSGRGIVDRRFQLMKADGSVAQEGLSGLLIARRASPLAATEG
jgi:acyl dehydratase